MYNFLLYDNFVLVEKKKHYLKMNVLLLYRLVMGTLLPGIKLPGFEADHSLPHRIEVKYQWSYTSLLSICLRGICAEKIAFLCYYKFKFPIQKLV